MDEVLVTATDGIGEVRINRPDKLNALTVAMLKAISGGIRELGGRDDVTAIILTGEGRAFSAGDDLKESLELDDSSFGTLIDSFQDVTRAIVECKLPVIAAVNGIAVGGAAEITIACDVRIGGPATEYFFPENGIGLTISNGSTVLIPALIGRRALGLVLLGKRIDVAHAERLGLLDMVTDSTDAVIEEARALASRLSADWSSTSVHLELLRPSLEVIEEALETERLAAIKAWDSGVVQSGLEKFWEQRSAPA
jgi:enoyl-CoA hydratase/carnithine racemase